MRRVGWLLLFVALTCGGLVSAQSRPDFSGAWTAPGKSISIKQDAATITVGDGRDARIYNLNGSESRFDVGRSQMTARGRWAGSAFVVEVTTVSPIGTWTDVEVYSMDYGQKLSVVQVRTQTTAPMMYTTVDTYSKIGSTARN
jgi:hypothetical protein